MRAKKLLPLIFGVGRLLDLQSSTTLPTNACSVILEAIWHKSYAIQQLLVMHYVV